MINQVIVRKTSLVIKARDMITFEHDAKSIEINYWKEGSEEIQNNPNGESYSGIVVEVPLKKLDDFTKIAAEDLSIENLVRGSKYYFRSRIILNDGSKGAWTSAVEETVGDNSNTAVISSPSVTETSVAVTFQVTSDIPSDFSHFEWYVKTLNKTSVNDTTPLDAPASPLSNASPTVITHDPNTVKLTLGESRMHWYYVWIRNVDTNGNKTAWFYVGAGGVEPIDLTSDGDDTPPDATSLADLTSNANYPNQNWV